MAKLFGFSIEDNNEKKSSSTLSPVPQNNEDGVDHYLTSGFFGSYVDIEGVYRTEFDLTVVVPVSRMAGNLELFKKWIWLAQHKPICVVVRGDNDGLVSSM